MRRSLILAITALTLLLPMTPASAQFVSPPFTGVPGGVTRIAGDTPAAYAVALSQAAYPDFPLSRSLIVSDVAFADALAASALASFAAIFFASPGQLLDDATLAELDRVTSPDGEVIIIGGTAVVDARVEGQVTAAGSGRSVRRLAGATRFETAVAVADEVLSTSVAPAELFVARAFGPDGNPTAAWADSVTAGPAAAALQIPILFTASTELHPSVAALVERTGPQRVTVLGGPSAVSDTTLQAIDAPTRRVAGSARDETAVRVYRQVLRDGFTNPRPVALVNLFDVNGWAYGLATAPVIGVNFGGILAINPAADLQTTQDVVACTRPTEVLVAGPEAQVPQERVESALRCPGDLGGSSLDDPLALRGDGLGNDIDFGQPADVVVDRLTQAFGAPSADTGRVQPFCELAGPDGPAGRNVAFANGLSVTFTEVAGNMVFDRWGDSGRSGLRTLAGIAAGDDTNRSIGIVYGADALLREGEPEGFPPPINNIDTPEGPIDAIMDGNDSMSQVTDLFGGGLSFCE